MPFITNYLVSDILTPLASYNTSHEEGVGKGFFRTSLRTEPHVALLNQFIAKLPTVKSKVDDKEVIGPDGNHNLTPPQLLELATIVQGKNDREGNPGYNPEKPSASSTLFTKLARKFGGFDALDRLQKTGNLKEIYVSYLVANFTVAAGEEGIAAFLVKLTPAEEEKTCLALLKALEFRVDPTSLPALASHYADHFLHMTPRRSFEKHLALLQFLNAHGVRTDNIVLTGILNQDDEFHQSLLTYLQSISKINKALINSNNLAEILQFNAASRVKRFLDLVLPLQENLDNFFAYLRASQSRQESPWLGILLQSFKDAECDVSPYLKQIFANESKLHNLSIAVATLFESKFPNDMRRHQLLSKLFEYSDACIVVAKALRKLQPENGDWNDDYLARIFANPEYAEKLADAINSLIHSDLYTSETLPTALAQACSSPKHAVNLANFIILWDGIYGGSQPTPAAVLNNPENIEITAGVIKYLQENKVSEDASVNLAICEANLADDDFLSLLKIMKKADLLSVSNVKSLVPLLGKIQALYGAFVCLEQGGTVNQDNFEALIGNPDDPMAVAVILQEPEKATETGIPVTGTSAGATTTAEQSETPAADGTKSPLVQQGFFNSNINDPSLRAPQAANTGVASPG
jgi:hypothetical protein